MKDITTELVLGGQQRTLRFGFLTNLYFNSRWKELGMPAWSQLEELAELIYCCLFHHCRISKSIVDFKSEDVRRWIQEEYYSRGKEHELKAWFTKFLLQHGDLQEGVDKMQRLLKEIGTAELQQYPKVINQLVKNELQSENN